MDASSHIRIRQMSSTSRLVLAFRVETMSASMRLSRGAVPLANREATRSRESSRTTRSGVPKGATSSRSASRRDLLRPICCPVRTRSSRSSASASGAKGRPGGSRRESRRSIERAGRLVTRAIVEMMKANREHPLDAQLNPRNLTISSRSQDLGRSRAGHS